ncbi:putative mitochondrial protein, conserved [Arachnomyces sp. PD_36]|nr:putative mitochondrial protein, conserved [Arachnomyces sp. PD_36]
MASHPRLTLLRALQRGLAPRPLSHTRPLSTTPSLQSDSRPNPFATGPSPPRLPKEEQDIFEELQRQSTGAFSTPRSTPKINQSPDSAPEEAAANTSSPKVEIADGEELHPHIHQGARPEFEGDKNPKTGEVGGPKNEPLRWGGEGDWSYNGRVTDF